MIANIDILIILLTVLLACSIGFKKYVWFISIGYGLSISIIGITEVIIHFGQLEILYYISCLTLFLYGIRLSGYLAYREIKSSTYNTKMRGEISDGSNMKLHIKILLWLSCALLYITMTSPIIYRIENNTPTDKFLIIGIIVIILGITFESISDIQKNNAKKQNPNKFVSTGLYKIVRCPNYLGELIVWTGVFITGINNLSSVGEYIISIIGYLAIIYIMFSGARRLEIRQDKNYESDKKYIEYKAKTPILIPFIPLYSVKKHKWLVG